MKLNYEDITTIKDIPPVTDKNSYVVLDVELFGANNYTAVSGDLLISAV